MLRLDEIILHPTSYQDSIGRLFWYKGELYRAILFDKAEFYYQLFEKGIIQNLIDKGFFIETKIADIKLEGYGLVLKHRSLPFVSYSHEWCAEMLKDAALLIIDMELELLNYNLLIEDPHSRNVLFEGCHPIYIDLGSIVPANSMFVKWFDFDTLYNNFIYPLHLMALGQDKIARTLLHAPTGVEKPVVDAFLALNHLNFEKNSKNFDIYGTNHEIKKMSTLMISFCKKYLPPVLLPSAKKSLISLISAKRAIVPEDNESKIRFFQGLRKSIENIDVPIERKNLSNLEDTFHSFTPSSNWTNKIRTVYEVILAKGPTTLLDFTCDGEWYSQLAATMGVKVVIIDRNSAHISQIYINGQDEENISILPLIMDFLRPSPGLGICNKEFPPATQRLKCDMVLCLDFAFIHQLIYETHLDFKQIVESFSLFSNKWLLLEFNPKEDRYRVESLSGKYPWYTLENLITALKSQFPNVTVFPSHPDPIVLLVCEK